VWALQEWLVGWSDGVPAGCCSTKVAAAGRRQWQQPAGALICAVSVDFRGGAGVGLCHGLHTCVVYMKVSSCRVDVRCDALRTAG
jgi:hypothetical protein